MKRDLTRRAVLAHGAKLVASGVVGGLALPLLGTSGRVAEAASTAQQTGATRAVATYNAMQRYFYANDRSSLYRETYPVSGTNRYSYLWPFSRALLGTLDLDGVPSSLVGGTSYASAVRDRLTGLGQYWDGATAYDSYVISQGGGDKYYDDNAWIGLALIQHHRMGLDSAGTSLTRADQLFTFAKSGWDTNANDPDPGGVFWVDALWNRDRGTVSNAPNGELGFHLHDLTRKAVYDGDGTVVRSPAALGATNMVNWVNKYLDSSGNGTGLFWDKVLGSPAGSIDTTLWSYNQGTMLGANLLRYRLLQAAGDPTASTYLQRAQTIASKTLTQYGNTFIGQPPSFNAICFRNLLLLYAVSPNPAYLSAMQSFADWAWTKARDPRTNVFYFSDGGQSTLGTGQPASLRDQGAMVQVNALLAWNASDYPKLA